ncbi:ABC transporter ATP-binding protein [Anatilimnocola floriformis]|uniref:ABC transporter ATP-binding protein n=1 Tax=Anatilimnocola floriformis TaxID=2948575 RepID=UPI0020C2C080|nr:ABC transporter ATP-binding protein [Anatilimnocola floriformis]
MDESGTVAELRLMARRARQVLPFVATEDRMTLAFAAALMAVVSVANTGVALLLGQLVDRIQSGAREQYSHTQMYWAAGLILLSLAGIYLVREVINVVRRTFVERSVARLNRDMQLKLVGHALRGDLTSLNGEKVGVLHGKIFRSVDGLIRFVRLMFLDCLPAFLTGAFAIIAAACKQPLLGLIMLGVIPLAVYLTLRQLKSQKGVRTSLMRDCEEIDGAVVEQLGGAEYIRVAHTYNFEMFRLTQSAEKRRKSEVKHHFEMSVYGCLKALNEGFFHIIVLAMATYLAIHGKISFGDVLTFSVLFLNVMAPLNEVHRVLDEGHEASLRVGDLLQMLETPLDRSFATPNHDLSVKTGQPLIEIDDLLVQYQTPDGKTRLALDHLTLSIHHGETIGVAGRSGSGKSTWIKVLLRLVHPQGGQLKLGGRPLEEVSREELAGLVSYVGQNPFVFSGTIRDNITYGNGDVNQADVEHAAQQANLHDEILQMPLGYQAQVTERGQNLSGGQRQRLAIARLLLKNAPILILDEATSALDNISERHVQSALGIRNPDRTTILIAHRLSTLKNCDRILVFEDGRVTAIGSYDELMEQDGLFSDLVHCAEAEPDVAHKLTPAVSH